MPCENCGAGIPEMPEDATSDELVCDRCYEDDEEERDADRQNDEREDWDRYLDPEIYQG